MINAIPVSRNTNQLTFEGRYPNKVYSDVRDIPNLPCAKCGQKMLVRMEDQNFLTKIRPVLKTCLKKLKKFEKVNGYKILEQLANKYPKDNIDKILLREEEKEQTNLLSPKLVNEVRAITYNAPFVIKKLEKYRKYMDSTALELFDIMSVYAQKYPKMTFGEILTMPEIFNFHKEAVLLEKAAQEVKAQRIFDKMKVLTSGKHTSQNSENSIQGKLTIANCDAIRIIKNNTNDDGRDLMLEQVYKNVLADIQNPKDVEKFKKLIKSLPKLSSNPHRIIVNTVQNESPHGIIYHLMNKINTFEHIKPKSQKGENGKHNGIYLCSDCNNKRGTTPYSEEFTMFPDFAKNTQKQASIVMRYILRGKLTGYDYYPQEVKKTLYEESGHIFKLDIKKYLKEQIKKYTDSLNKTRERFQKSREDVNNNKKELTKLQQKQKILKRKNKKNYEDLKKQKNKLEEIKQILKDDNNFGEDSTRVLE